MKCPLKGCEGSLQYVDDTLTKELPNYTFSLKTKSRACKECYSKYYDAKTLAKFELKVAEWIVQHWFTDTFSYTPRHFQFIRKVLGRNRGTMADMLGVEVSTLDSWEDKGKPDFRSLLSTSLALVDAILDQNLEDFPWEVFEIHTSKEKTHV